jgi:hypothetical protein
MCTLLTPTHPLVSDTVRAKGLYLRIYSAAALTRLRQRQQRGSSPPAPERARQQRGRRRPAARILARQRDGEAEVSRFVTSLGLIERRAPSVRSVGRGASLVFAACAHAASSSGVKETKQHCMPLPTRRTHLRLEPRVATRSYSFAAVSVACCASAESERTMAPPTFTHSERLPTAAASGSGSTSRISSADNGSTPGSPI